MTKDTTATPINGKDGVGGTNLCTVCHKTWNPDEKRPCTCDTNGKRDKKQKAKKHLSCDDVCWLKDILKRYGDVIKDGVNNRPRCSRLNDAAMLSAVIEIMSLLGCTFADRSARHNAISQFPELYPDNTSDSPV